LSREQNSPAGAPPARPRAAGKPGRQPPRHDKQNQHYQPAGERRAEKERTGHQVRVRREAFAEPLGAPGARRVTGERLAPPLQEPDDRRENDGGAEHHQNGGEPSLSVG
jgi:hypothetical protein